MDYLAVCLYVKDEEEDYLKEWVSYHTLVGVERFLIYDNLSRIPVRQTLAKEVALGRVIVLDCPQKFAQQAVYAHCLQHFSDTAQWIAFIDTDEFLVPKQTADVRAVLGEYESYGGLAVFWRMFGSSGYLDKPDGMQILHFTQAAPDDFNANHMIKSIVQTRYVIFPMRAHHFIYKDGYAVVNEAGEPVKGPETPRTVDKLQLNHYFTRSRAQFQSKISRGQSLNVPDRTMSEFDWYDRSSTIVDKQIWDVLARLFPDHDPQSLSLADLEAQAAACPPPAEQVFLTPSMEGLSLTDMEQSCLLYQLLKADRLQEWTFYATVLDAAEWQYKNDCWKIPWFAEAFYKLWDYLLEHARNLTELGHMLEKAFECLEPTPELLKRAGIFSYANGDYAQAEFHWKRALGTAPVGALAVEILINLGRMYYDQGRYAAALDVLNLAQRIQPQDMEVKRGLSSVKAKMGQSSQTAG